MTAWQDLYFLLTSTYLAVVVVGATGTTLALLSAQKRDWVLADGGPALLARLTVLLAVLTSLQAFLAHYDRRGEFFRPSGDSIEILRAAAYCAAATAVIAVVIWPIAVAIAALRTCTYTGSPSEAGRQLARWCGVCIVGSAAVLWITGIRPIPGRSLTQQFFMQEPIQAVWGLSVGLRVSLVSALAVIVVSFSPLRRRHVWRLVAQGAYLLVPVGVLVGALEGLGSLRRYDPLPELLVSGSLAMAAAILLAGVYLALALELLGVSARLSRAARWQSGTATRRR
jgi:hypothetical protein